ncbi:hypothetical protein RSAG8_12450, partial [Rhizoctonia solani AG-8 WAC10335]
KDTGGGGDRSPAIAALKQLLADVTKEWAVEENRVIGHVTLSPPITADARLITVFEHRASLSAALAKGLSQVPPLAAVTYAASSNSAIVARISETFPPRVSYELGVHRGDWVAVFETYVEEWVLCECNGIRGLVPLMCLDLGTPEFRVSQSFDAHHSASTWNGSAFSWSPSLLPPHTLIGAQAPSPQLVLC